MDREYVVPKRSQINMLTAYTQFQWGECWTWANCWHPVKRLSEDEHQSWIWSISSFTKKMAGKSNLYRLICMVCSHLNQNVIKTQSANPQLRMISTSQYLCLCMGAVWEELCCNFYIVSELQNHKISVEDTNGICSAGEGVGLLTGNCYIVTYEGRMIGG